MASVIISPMGGVQPQCYFARRVLRDIQPNNAISYSAWLISDTWSNSPVRLPKATDTEDCNLADVGIPYESRGYPKSVPYEKDIGRHMACAGWGWAGGLLIGRNQGIIGYNWDGVASSVASDPLLYGSAMPFFAPWRLVGGYHGAQVSPDSLPILVSIMRLALKAVGRLALAIASKIPPRLTRIIALVTTVLASILPKYPSIVNSRGRMNSMGRPGLGVCFWFARRHHVRNLLNV